MNRTAVEEIKARIPIDELVGTYVKLERAGKSLKARCPFHNEKSASFFVSPDRGGYYCFGCGAKGDIFSFVEQFEGLDFKGALKVLAERAGVPLVVNEKIDSEKDRLFTITEQAAQFFESQFVKSKEALDYLKKRGISETTRKDFRIGWAPDGWKNLYTFLKGKGWSDMVMEKAGLIKRKDEGEGYRVKGIVESQLKSEISSPSTLNPTPSYYDRFRGRIMFPITDSSGRVIGFTGRILIENDKAAKYLNSPDSPLFNKSQVLFGLDKAKNEIRRVGYSILVEGQMDLVLSHQVGVKNTVAASGTALTSQVQDESGVVSNLGMVRRLSPNMIIALDSDAAGRTAAMRAVAATALAMGMSVKIADIEGGKDPADLILSDPESWKQVLRNAKHVVEFELGNVIRDTVDTHKLAKAVRERVFPFLIRIDSDMDKAYYVKLISDKIGMNEQAIWEDMRKFAKEKPEVGGPQPQPFGGNSSSPQPRVGGAPLSVAGVSPLNPIRGIGEKSFDRRGADEASRAKNTESSSSSTRLDIVERRMFGLLHLMEAARIPRAKEYREQIKKIAGGSFQGLLEKIKPIENDIAFEAESLFGADTKGFNMHMKELISNFEEDLINKELVTAMAQLRLAEREGDTAKVVEMAKRCQELSKKKAGLRKH